MNDRNEPKKEREGRKRRVGENYNNINGYIVIVVLVDRWIEMEIQKLKNQSQLIVITRITIIEMMEMKVKIDLDCYSN